MRIFLDLIGDVVDVRVRVEGEGMVGDDFAELRPGQSFYRIPYDELRKHAPGVVEVDDQWRVRPVPFRRPTGG